MVFATVSGNPTEKETEEITGLWQGSLFNGNYDVQRQFLTEDVKHYLELCVAVCMVDQTVNEHPLSITPRAKKVLCMNRAWKH